MAEEILEEMEEGEGRGLFSVLILLLLLIVLIGAYMFISSSNNSQESTDGSPTQASNENTYLETDSISASANSEDDQVLADRVLLQEPGYIVIHLDDDGRPGAVIGNSQLLSEGEHENITIDIVSDLREGETIYVMLHFDDGDEVYEFPDGDGPITDEFGDPVMAVIEVDSVANNEFTE